MGVPMKIQVGEICNGVVGAPRRHFTGSHEASEALNYLDVHEVRRMQFVLVAKETGLDPGAKRSLQKELQQSRRVDDDHADSRSSRIITAAGVFSVTRFRLCSLPSISSRVGRAARRPISARR